MQIAADMQQGVYEQIAQFDFLFQMLATFLQMKWILAVLEVISSVMMMTAVIILHRETSGVQSTTHVELQTQLSFYNGYETPSPPQR